MRFSQAIKQYCFFRFVANTAAESLGVGAMAAWGKYVTQGKAWCVVPAHG